jgi:hypothetical protein
MGGMGSLYRSQHEFIFVYKNGIIFLNCSPVVRNEIIMRKEKILKELREQLVSCNILDIK